MSWVAIVPVKGTPAAKTRLIPHPERLRLAEAFALDTVSVLLAAPSVAHVYVVTADDAVAERMRALGAEIVRESSPSSTLQVEFARPAGVSKAGASVAEGQGDTSDPRRTATGSPVLPGAFDPLNAAIRQGTEAVRALTPADGAPNIAVVTGDLPALTVGDLESALGLAEAHDRSMVADEEGTGTTMLLALAGIPLEPHFGLGSRAAHERAGHLPLEIEPTATSRRDVDTVENLAEALRFGVGRFTSALIASTADVSQPLAPPTGAL